MSNIEANDHAEMESLFRSYINAYEGHEEDAAEEIVAYLNRLGLDRLMGIEKRAKSYIEVCGESLAKIEVGLERASLEAQKNVAHFILTGE